MLNMLKHTHTHAHTGYTERLRTLLLWSPPLLVLVLEILLNTPLELGLLVNSTLPHLLDRRLRVPSVALPRALLPVYSRRPLPARRARCAVIIVGPTRCRVAVLTPPGREEARRSHSRR